MYLHRKVHVYIIGDCTQKSEKGALFFRRPCSIFPKRVHYRNGILKKRLVEDYTSKVINGIRFKQWDSDDEIFKIFENNK